MVLICLFNLWGELGPGIYNFEATPPKNKNKKVGGEGSFYYCGPNIKLVEKTLCSIVQLCYIDCCSLQFIAVHWSLQTPKNLRWFHHRQYSHAPPSLKQSGVRYWSCTVDLSPLKILKVYHSLYLIIASWLFFSESEPKLDAAESSARQFDVMDHFGNWSLFQFNSQQL